VWFCVIICLSSLDFPLSGTIGANTIQQWWGNRVYKETADWQYVPLKTVSSGNPFGCVPCIADYTAYTDRLAYTIDLRFGSIDGLFCCIIMYLIAALNTSTAGPRTLQSHFRML
jgi:hypothetical protein